MMIPNQLVSLPYFLLQGYMDAIAMWQARVRETVASMGTALSLEQLQAAATSARNMGGEFDSLCLLVPLLEQYCFPQRFCVCSLDSWKNCTLLGQ